MRVILQLPTRRKGQAIEHGEGDGDVPRIPIPKTPPKFPKIAVINQKGGVGKTTTAAAIAQAAALRGLLPLAVDLDPQANLTTYLGGDRDLAGTAGVLFDGAPLSASVQRVGGIDLSASSIQLAAAEIALSAKAGRDGILARALARCPIPYDIAVFDTPPGLGSLLFNALVAADHAVVATSAERFAMDKTFELPETVEQIRECTDGRLSILGIVETRWQGRTNVQRDFDDALCEWAEGQGIPILGRVRQSVVVQEAQARGQSVFEYKPRSGAAKDYASACEALLCALDEEAAHV